MIILNDSLEIRRDKAIDIRMVFDDIAERDAFSNPTTGSPYMYNGLVSYVKSDEKVYVFATSVWKEIGSGAIPPEFQEHIDNNGIHLTVNEKGAITSANSASSANPFATMGDLTTTGTTHVVETVVEMLALTGVIKGDRCIITNNVGDITKNGEWRAQVNTPTQESDWLQLPDLNNVISVAGKTGIITLTPDDIEGLTDVTVDDVIHENGNVTIPNGAQWVYDSVSSKMKLVLGGGRTSSLIQSTIAIGGILKDTSYPIGTQLQSIITELLSPSSISTLRYNDWVSFVKVNFPVIIDTFVWNIEGSPSNLVLNDDKGQLPLNTPVSGSSHNLTPITYNYQTYNSVKWTLNGDNVNPTTVTTYWVNEVIFGLKDDSAPPTNTEIELSTSTLLALTSSQIWVDFNMSSAKYSWVAIPKTQTGRTYGAWFIADSNNGLIATGNLFYLTGEVTLNSGVEYYVYMTSYKTQLPSRVKFS